MLTISLDDKTFREYAEQSESIKFFINNIIEQVTDNVVVLPKCDVIQIEDLHIINLKESYNTEFKELVVETIKQQNVFKDFIITYCPNFIKQIELECKSVLVFDSSLKIQQVEIFKQKLKEKLPNRKVVFIFVTDGIDIGEIQD